MKRIFLFSTLFILLGLVPAQTAARARTIKGSGVMRTETREAGRYTGLKVARGVAATIVESDSEKLVVEADEKIIGYVVTTIDKQGVLLLTIDPEIDNIRDCDVRISVPKPEVLQSLTATSGGRVTCRTVVNTPTLNVRTTSGAHAEIACEGDGCTPLGHQRLRNQGQSGRRPVRDRSAQRSRNKCQGSGRGVQNQRHVGSHLQGPQSADPAYRSARFVGRFGAHHLLRDARSRRFVGRKRLLLGRLPTRRFQKEPDRIRHP